jgi:serine/threonine-protein kinase RsbT
MAEELLRRTFQVRGRDFDKAGETSAEIKGILKGLGIDAGTIRRAVVVTFEAEMNVVMYADLGTVTFVLSDEDITLDIVDRGPGIPDLQLAMQEGFSTATDEMREMGFGFGMGLPNMRKNADDFTLESEVGIGTRLRARILLDANA